MLLISFENYLELGYNGTPQTVRNTSVYVAGNMLWANIELRRQIKLLMQFMITYVVCIFLRMTPIPLSVCALRSRAEEERHPSAKIHNEQRW